MKNKFIQTIIILICLCFLLGWDLGLLISNKWYEQENKEQKEYIEVLEMNIKRDELLKIQRRMNK